MSEMIERCVKAAFNADWRTSKLHPDDQRKIVVAIIEAMRDATDEQRNAYYELSHKTEVMFDSHWERAIDAALAEKVDA